MTLNIRLISKNNTGFIFIATETAFGATQHVKAKTTVQLSTGHKHRYDKIK